VKNAKEEKYSILTHHSMQIETTIFTITSDTTTHLEFMFKDFTISFEFGTL